MLKSGSQPNRQLDEVDERIIEALRERPRATSKWLSEHLGLTELVVGSRIKAMERDNLMRVVAQVDFRALGYGVLALVDVRVRNGKIAAVAKALAIIEGVGSVSIMLGDPPIVAQVQARDLAGLRDLLLNEVSTIDGVEQVETNIIAHIETWRLGTGRLETVPGVEDVDGAR